MDITYKHNSSNLISGGMIIAIIFLVMFSRACETEPGIPQPAQYENSYINTVYVCEDVYEILDEFQHSYVPPAYQQPDLPLETDWDLIMIRGVKRFEGYYAEPYICPAGVRTVGYGHTGKYSRTVVCKDRAKELLYEELAAARAIVDRVVKVDLTPHQQAALVSFTFNTGERNLRRLVNGPDRLNDGNYASIEKLLPMYRKGGGKVLRGLEIRRAWELDLWCGNI